MIIWDLKMLTLIDGKPLKAGLLLRGSTVLSVPGIYINLKSYSLLGCAIMASHGENDCPL